MSYIDVTGKTEEDAISNALRQLGMDRDDVSVEILERAKSGFLGLGSCPARIRVTYGTEEPSVSAVEEKTPVKSVRAQKPAEPQIRFTPRSEDKEPEKTVKKPAPESTEREVQHPAQPEKPAVPTAAAEPEEEVDDEKAQAIRTFLSGLLEQMECQAEVRVYLPEKGRYRVILVGENLGALIGRRGETLDAIQQLTSYSVNRSGSGRVRVQLDAENYREKREQSLEHLAQKVAGKVVKYRRSVTLEPMNAYERHVIHTALQDVSCVTTYSTGTEPSRRVIVAYDRDKK